jgi:hypothetical protein
VTSRYPIGRRVAVGEHMPTAAEMNELLEERDQLAASAERLLADPTVTRYTDGRVGLTWPHDDAIACTVARPVIEALVADLNRMRAQLDAREQDDIEAAEEAS